MSRFEGPQGIVTNGLVLNLDAGDPDSYTRSQPPYVEVLVVAGGGGGSGNPANNYRSAGGGGGGGVIYNSAYQLSSAAAVTVTVGSGGAGSQDTGTNGSNSVFGSLTAIGGGRGGSTTHGTTVDGANGGSGGGGGDYNGNGGTGTAGQGFNGGNSRQSAGIGAGASGGGGGGAGGPGSDCINSYSTISGGPSITYSISGTSTSYAAGGASLSAADTNNPAGASGGTNTGTGGQGARFNVGGNGGSGIVIVRYPGLPAATGGTITYLNGYTIHTFTTSGTFTPYLWNDVSGNNNSGSLVNGVGFNSYQNGGFLTFDGTDDYAPIGTTGFSFGASAGTLSAWAKTNTISGGFSWIVSYGNPSTSQSRFIGIGNSTYYFGGYSDDITSSGVPLNTWFNITGVFNGTNASMYINGILVSGPTAKSWNTVANNAQVGRQTNNSEYWNGNIAQVSIYNRALSAAEITQNYNAQKSRFGL